MIKHEQAVIMEKTKFIMPQNKETYAFIVGQLSGEQENDPDVISIISNWGSLSKADKDKIMDLLNGGKKKEG
jgi:hypothetical protein